jgi:hypothetical protein
MIAAMALALLAAGAYGLARSFGAFGRRAASDRILAGSWPRFVGDNSGWFWPVMAAASLLLALFVVLPWLRAQLVPARPGMVNLTRPSGRGVTELRSAGAARALAGDVETYRGVQGASARLLGDPSAPEVDLRVDVADDCDLPALRRRIEEHAVARLRQALELGDDMAVTVEFRLREPAGRQLR